MATKAGWSGRSAALALTVFIGLAAPASPAPFSVRLPDEAANFSVPGLFAVDVRSHDDVLIEWTVHYVPDALWQHLNAVRYRADAPPCERLLAWMREKTDAMVRLTEATALTESLSTRATTDAEGQTRLDIPVVSVFSDTDVRVRFFERHSQVAEFVGRRLMWLRWRGQSARPDPATTSLDEVVVEVRVSPTRTTWSLHEAVTGQFKIKNVGRRRIALNSDGLPAVVVFVDADKPAEWRPPKVGRCGGIWSGMPIFLQPGESHTRAFEIQTDPLELGGSCIMPPGRYTIGYPSLLGRDNTPMRVIPASITVEHPDEPLPLRIISFRASNDRLMVLRENGRIDAHDLESGAWRFSITIPKFDPQPGYEGAEEFSPDGRYLALLRSDYNQVPWQHLDFHRLSPETPQPVVVPLPRDRTASGDWDVRGFSLDSTTFRLVSGESLLEIATADGREKRRTPLEHYPAISPLGDHSVATTADQWPTSPMHPESPVPLLVRELGSAAPCELLFPVGQNSRADLLCQRGFFVHRTVDDNRLVEFYDYDGQPCHWPPVGAGPPIIERPDGRAVLFTRGSPSSGRRAALYAIGDNDPLWERDLVVHRGAHFTPDSRFLILPTPETPPMFGVFVYRPDFLLVNAATGDLVRTLTIPTVAWCPSWRLGRGRRGGSQPDRRRDLTRHYQRRENMWLRRGAHDDSQEHPPDFSGRCDR